MRMSKWTDCYIFSRWKVADEWKYSSYVSLASFSSRGILSLGRSRQHCVESSLQCIRDMCVHYVAICIAINASATWIRRVRYRARLCGARVRHAVRSRFIEREIICLAKYMHIFKSAAPVFSHLHPAFHHAFRGRLSLCIPIPISQRYILNFLRKPYRLSP